jgi:outer membrane protein, heavy metal efflux system
MNNGMPGIVARRKPMADRFCAPLGSALVALCVSALSPRLRAAPPLDEVAATRQVCTTGSSVALARAQRLRGRAEVTVAGVLPNPFLVAEHQRSFSGSAESETIVGLSLPLGIGGRRFLMKDAADERQRQGEAGARVTLFESAIAFREAYTRAALEHARYTLLSERQALLDGLSTTIQRLVQGGEAAGYDLGRQKAQAAMHRSAVAATKARAFAARLALEAWTGGSFSVSVDTHHLATADLPNRGLSPPRTARVAELEADARASASEARAAARKWVPDLEVFAGYRRLRTELETGHGVSLGLTFPITLFDHGQGDAARADAEHDLALASAAKIKREQEAELGAAATLLLGLKEALVSAETAAAQAAEVEGEARQLYAAGEASITELLEAFRSTEEAELARLAIVEEIAGTRLRAMRASGSLFDAKLDGACGGGRRGAP